MHEAGTSHRRFRQSFHHDSKTTRVIVTKSCELSTFGVKFIYMLYFYLNLLKLWLRVMDTKLCGILKGNFNVLNIHCASTPNVEDMISCKSSVLTLTLAARSACSIMILTVKTLFINHHFISVSVIS